MSDPPLPVLDPARCTGCGDCVAVCPTNCLEMSGGVVRKALVVLGHVAPTPWVSLDAAAALAGMEVGERTAQAAGNAAVAGATPLSENDYKVQIARTAVKRAILRAAGQLEGALS